MLVKQQTKAILEARKEMIDTTVSIIDDVTNRVGNTMSDSEKNKLITYLTCSMIGNNNPSPVYNIDSNGV